MTQFFNGYSMFFDDPENLQEFIEPVGGKVFIRPMTGDSFNAEICMKRLHHVSLFSLSTKSFTAIKKSQEGIFGLTIPLSTPFTVTSSGKQQTYESSLAHMLLPGRPFNLSAQRKGNFLVINFNADSISHYSNNLFQSDYQGLSSMDSDVLLLSREGGVLLRAIAQAWSALNNKLPISELALKELEDNLFASLVLYSSRKMNVSKSLKDDTFRLNRTVEYINENLKNPITRDTLAEVFGRSIRTLSRTFEKKYGIGPITYIKQRRLDSAYLELLSLNSDITTVSKTAFKYGFSHMGKFAIEYRKNFGESPSKSLSK